MKLTPEEKRAIATLKRLAKKWPDSLWLYSAGGTLNIMRKIDGKRAFCGASPDSDTIVDTIEIENDGGDW